MSFIDRGDEDFERALRHSARGDAPAADATARAWSRFVRAASSVPGWPGSVTAPPSAASPVSRLRNAVATAKWVLLGAIGGSAVTFALVDRHAGPPARATSPGPLSSLRDPPAEAPGEAAPSPRDALETQPGTGAVSVSTVVWPSPGPASTRRASPLANVARLGLATPAETSSLAAEVAALDAARGALDADAPDDALALLHRYLLGFPKGKLAPEAEVLAIEAYAKKGDRLLLTREATRFLDRYPKAPQRTRVEQLCAEASPRRSPP